VKNFIKANAILFFLLFLCNFLIQPPVIYGAENEPPFSGTLIGTIEDAETGEEIGWTTLLLEEINRSVSAHEDGSFHFYDVLPGVYTLKTFRVGYQDASFSVRIIEDDTTSITIKLNNDPLSTEGIVIESDKFDAVSKLKEPAVEVSGKTLRQNLGTTIAKTIEAEPGIAQRTMGPAPARPVLRGLSGDRLLILEDGERTGDLSATSSDHAVVIEPISAERIEVIRGPAALIYGSNTLGGVINVSRGYVPSTLPHRITGSFALQGESVNNGYTGGLNVTAPLGPLAVRIEGSIRQADDIRAPKRTLTNTNIETKNAAAGLSYFPSWGFIGSSASTYKSAYGIPPDPFGGHPNGVNIDLERQHIETKSEIHPGIPWLYRIDLSHSYKRYKHTETESSGQLGVRFGLVTQDATITSHFSQKGTFIHGDVGLWGEMRDYASSGLNFTPASKEYSYAAFLYGEHDVGNFGFSASLRYDHKSVVPHTEKFVERADFSLHIRQRDFDDFSAGFTGVYNLSSSFSLGTTIMRTYRAPGIEELFSEGPHLAAYAYEVGNSELDKEIGFGIEIFFDYDTDGGKIHLALFRNDIQGYIFPKNTGRRSLRRADLFLYQYVGEHALMNGFEATLDWQLIDPLLFMGSLSFVKGDLVDRGEPIPRIPPLKGRAALRIDMGSLSIEGGMRYAARQDRPGEFETPTNGFVVLDFSTQYYFNLMGFLHTLNLSIENAMNTTYRQHLNRVKLIMPEPGRNVKLLYKVYF
jgi:iron complex outermembrane receptor protein